MPRKFEKGNRLAAKLRWSRSKIEQFQKDLCALRKCLHYRNEDLAKALDYSPKYVRMLQGNWGYMRQPSEEFLKRLEEFKKAAVPRPSFQGVLAYDPKIAGVPMCQILAAFKQCPECAWEVRYRYRDENESWWAMRTPQQKYCTPKHGNAFRARKKKNGLRRKRYAERRNAKRKKPRSAIGVKKSKSREHRNVTTRLGVGSRRGRGR